MKFKSLIISVLGLFIFSFQILKPVKWTFSPSKKGAKVGETIELVFKGKIDPGWYLYSSDLKVDGPMPTEIEFDQNGSFQLVGKLMPINAKEKYDEIWEGKVNYFVKEAKFIQKVKILKSSTEISGKIKCQTCTEKDGKCVPNRDKFSISI